MRIDTFVTAALGKRCESTVLLGPAGFEALMAAFDPVEVLSYDGARVFDIRAARAQRPDALVCVDNSHAGCRISPAVMRGADIVFDDLSTMAPGCGVRAVSRVRGLDDAATEKIREAAKDVPGPDALSMAEAWADGYEAADRARDDLARVVVPYLSCHPAVEEVVYAGAGELAETARRVFERGFGNRVRIRVAGGCEAIACALFDESGASGSLVELGDGALLYLAGEGDASREVEAFEEALKVCRTV